MSITEFRARHPVSSVGAGYAALSAGIWIVFMLCSHARLVPGVIFIAVVGLWFAGNAWLDEPYQPYTQNADEKHEAGRPTLLTCQDADDTSTKQTSRSSTTA